VVRWLWSWYQRVRAGCQFGYRYVLHSPGWVWSLAYPSYCGSDADPCRWVTVLNGCPLIRLRVSAFLIRTSERVPRGTRMVGPGKIPL
jgi:hypothetical protein